MTRSEEEIEKNADSASVATALLGRTFLSQGAGGKDGWEACHGKNDPPKIDAGGIKFFRQE